MIERRYPIQTVLAERKMFAGGGAVLPQQMMPQQQQPGGILASSGPLLDAVAAGAINPDGDGGGSLSEVQGFFNGGVNLINDYRRNPDDTYTQIVPEQIAQPKSAAEQIAAIQSVTGEPDPAAGLINRYSRDPADGTVTRVGADTGDSPAMMGPILKSIFKNAMVGQASKVEESAKTDPNGPPSRDFDFGYDRSLLESEDTLNEEYLDDGAPSLGAGTSEASETAPRTVSEGSTEELFAVEEAKIAEEAKILDEGSAEPEARGGKQQDLFNTLTRKGVNADNAVGALEDTLSRAVKASAGDSSVDIESLKSDLEALLPAVEGNDDVTEGLMLIRLAAAIGAGTSSSGWENISKGVEKALPAMIEYRAKRKSDERGRQMSIAKMAIQQKLSLDAETRAEDRSIRKEDRATLKENLKTKQYMVVQPTTIAASRITEGAEGNITVPKMPVTLDAYGKERFRQLNIPIVEMAKITFKPADLQGPQGVHFSSLDAKEQNRYYTDPTYVKSAPFAMFGNEFKYKFMSPKISAYSLFGPNVKQIINPGEAKALFKAYKNVSRDYGKMYDELTALSGIAQQGGLVGTGSIKGQIGTALKGLASVSFMEGFGINKFANQLMSGFGDGKYQELSQQDKFTARGRLLLAKMAPIILGESGKTISDADRILVAESLGFVVNKIPGEDGKVTFGGITGFNSKVLQNPQSVTNAIEKTGALIRDRYELIHSTYQQEMSRFDMNIPSLKPFAPIKREKSGPLRFNLVEGQS